MTWIFHNRFAKHMAVFFLGLSSTVLLNASMQEEPPRRISVKKVAAYLPVTPVLQKMVDRADEDWLDKTATRGANHLYVARVSKWRDGVHSTWVYWKEARAVILWEPGLTYDRREDELWLSRRFLSLKEDVVATPDEIGGSNYLMDRKSASELVADCVNKGDLFVIVKRAR